MRSDAGVVGVHTERTTDPRVLRWVVRGDELRDVIAGPRRPAASTPLGALLADGTIASVHVAAGEIRIEADALQWPSNVRMVDDAVRGELEGRAAWLTDDPEVAAEAPWPSIAAFQAALDADGAALAASHGGAFRVNSVEGSTIAIELLGACGHCPLADDTLTNVVLPAARRVDARITSVRLAGRGSARETTRRVPLLRRRASA